LGLSTQKLKRVRPFKTLFQSNKEELENFNSFQNLIFINKVPPPLATPLTTANTICKTKWKHSNPKFILTIHKTFVQLRHRYFLKSQKKYILKMPDF